MTFCKKLALVSDGTRGEVVFLESRYNYFERKNDWFVVNIVYDGSRAERRERKISTELAMRLLDGKGI